MLSCKKCTSQKYVKCGHIRGFQRYKCRECGCQFTATKARGVYPALRELGIILYAHFDVSMRGIALLSKVSTVAVLKWVRAYSDKISQTEKIETHPPEIIQVDEMWHFVNGKKTRYGSGEQLMGYHVNLLDGNWALVVMPVVRN